MSTYPNNSHGDAAYWRLNTRERMRYLERTFQHRWSHQRAEEERIRDADRADRTRARLTITAVITLLAIAWWLLA